MRRLATEKEETQPLRYRTACADVFFNQTDPVVVFLQRGFTGDDVSPPPNPGSIRTEFEPKLDDTQHTLPQRQETAADRRPAIDHGGI